MKKLIYILIAISITCFSCTKKSDDSGTPQSGLCRLSSHSTFMGTETYFYDSQNRIIKILYIEDSDSTWEYYYYESDHVKYRTLYYSDMQEDSVWFHYSSGKYTDAVSDQDSVHFTYNSSGQIARQDQYVAGDLATYTEYAYDAHGNCISEITWANSYSGPERDMWNEIEYGSGRNYYAVKLPPVDTYEAYWWMMTGPDNIMKFRIHYPDSDPQTLIWEYSGFNGNGYPVNYSIKDSAEGNIGVELAGYICP